MDLSPTETLAARIPGIAEGQPAASTGRVTAA
jgi:hypothetical protein